MKLTPFQKRNLDALEYMRTGKPSIIRALAFRPLSWIPFFVVAILSFVYYHFFDKQWGMFVLGVIAGAVLRIIAYARFTVLAWPVTKEVIDWAKVESLRNNKKEEGVL